MTAFWSDDERFIYYAFLPTTTYEILSWAAFDVSTHVTTIISSPLKYDDHVWQRLDTVNPRRLGIFPELQGYTSPSGNYVTYVPAIDTVTDMFTPTDPSAGVEVWIADSSGRHRTRTSFSAQAGMIYQAIWFKDESKVIFSFGYEGGPNVYIADVKSGQVMSLQDMSDFEGIEVEWALSPDDTTLAVVDQSDNLWLVSLETGKSTVAKVFGGCPQWSKDGKLLYHIWSLGKKEYLFRSYDVASGDISTILHKSKQDKFASNPSCSFAFSPSGNKIVLWGAGLWLVELRR